MELIVLTNDEQVELDILENTIERNLASFLEIGRALITIRDKRLYRDGYDTFETYCKERWKFKKSYAYYLIDASKVVQNVHHGGQIPATERQARPLAKLPPEQQQEAWNKSVETAPNGKVTAKHVEEIVSKFIVPVNERKPQLHPQEALQFARTALYHLERIRDDDLDRESALSLIEEWIKQKRESWIK